MVSPVHASALPIASPAETVAAIVAQGGRDHVPVRLAFLQRRVDGRPLPGPLHEFVANGDRRGLLLYLLLLAKATTKPWDASLPAAVWARALAHPMPNTKAAASAVSKAWARLEGRRLIERSRSKRMAVVKLLMEDGSGVPYEHPARGGAYLKLSHALWLGGPGDGPRWYELFTLPDLAMLLIASSLQPGFRLPYEAAPEWYGLSADTALRGLSGLAKWGLLAVDRSYKPAPLSPAGYTAENRYTLVGPFHHRARKMGPGASGGNE